MYAGARRLPKVMRCCASVSFPGAAIYSSLTRSSRQLYPHIAPIAGIQSHANVRAEIQASPQRRRGVSAYAQSQRAVNVQLPASRVLPHFGRLFRMLEVSKSLSGSQSRRVRRAHLPTGRAASSFAPCPCTRTAQGRQLRPLALDDLGTFAALPGANTH